jgi:Spy/CpxP family protein refolding chaperone
MRSNQLGLWILTIFLSLSSLGAHADDPAGWRAGCPMMGQGMMGHGMMGPGMMGPGMMGQGYGMMGQGMMGPGMMRGYGPMWLPDLKEDQQKKITAIYEELHKKRWDLITKLQGEYATLRGLYAADKRDPAAIGDQYKKISELRRQMVEQSVEAHNRMEAVLTKEQKERLRSYGPGWMMDE